MYRRMSAMILVCCLAATSAIANLASTEITNSSFTTIDDVLYNPGIGLSDFHHRSTFPYPTDARPTGKIAYFRFYWSDIEPVEGQVNTDLLDQAILTAASRGQVLGIRIMSADDSTTVRLPGWLVTQANALSGGGGAGQNLTPTGGSTYFFPNYDNPAIIAAASNLLAELGRRYDKNPYVYFVDVGMVGLWGEWHDGTGNSHMPTIANAKQYLDMHKAAFPHKPLVMLLGADPAVLQYGVSTYGMSWRADCWGDNRFFDSAFHGWNLVYPEALAAVTGIEDTWKTSPVLLESCGSIRSLYESTYNQPDPYGKFIDMMLFALGQHASSLNTAWNDEAIPEDLRPLFQSFLNQLGYRFVLDSFTGPSIVFNNGPTTLKSTWENIGSAPVYDGFRLSYRLRRADGAIVKQWFSATNLKTWLPGATTPYSDQTSALAADPDYNWLDAPAGDYKIDLALLWPQANHPAIALGTAGRRDDGWYEVGQTKLVNIYSHPSVTGLKPVITVPSYATGKDNVIDGNAGTWWHNGGILANGWIQVDLKQMRNINRIGYLDAYSRSLSVAVATQAAPSTWTVVKSQCVTAGSTTDYSYCSFPEINARYVKIYLDYGTQSVDPNNVWMETRELQVMEVPDSL